MKLDKAADRHRLIGYRPTWAEIDLSNLAYNLKQIQKTVGSQVKVMACVKADAYGHGLIPVSRRLVASGAEFLSVASVDEAVQLRKAGIRVPVLVLGMILKDDSAPLATHGISQTVCSIDLARTLNARAGRCGKRIGVHIKVDTGMGRIGVLHQEALSFIRMVRKLPHLRIEGIFTHLACADTNPSFTDYQITIFERLIADLRAERVPVPLIHAAHSLGVTRYAHSHFNMVRPGLALYGLYAQEGMTITLKPVMSLKTKVVYVKQVPRGWGISYGHTYVTKQATRVATLPIGYGDGYPRNLSNLAPVIIKGRLLTISGMVCMDQIMCDVGTFKVKVGDEVVLIGSQRGAHISTEELARLSGTIPYEIVCGIGSRVPRIYL